MGVMLFSMMLCAGVVVVVGGDEGPLTQASTRALSRGVTSQWARQPKENSGPRREKIIELQENGSGKGKTFFDTRPRLVLSQHGGRRGA